jgi:asparagine synthetase B (glutamine-hydrolysing)
MDIHSKILSFLDLGYFLDYPGETIRLPVKIEPVDQSGVTQEELFNTARQKWLISLEEGFSVGQTCVVPLSGGLDSRAVIAGLLQFTEASNITTYTFGIPGSFDYEIAAKVARFQGVPNIRIPLDHYEYSLEELIETSRRMDHQSLMFYHAPLRLVERDFSEGVHWSGFLGESITGDHVRGVLAKTHEEARMKFMEFNRYIKNEDAQLLKGGREYSLKHLKVPLDSQGFLTLEEGYDLLNRQNKYIAPHVMLKGFEHRAPFNNPDLMGFFLGLTEEQKRNQIFFKEFLQWWKPFVFAFPVKNNLGFPLNAAAWRPKLRKKYFALMQRMNNWKNPKLNYFDFSKELINNQNFKSLVLSQLEDVKSRRILPDVIKPGVLWKEHQNRQADHGRLIQGIASLEIHLKAGKEL